MIYFLLVQGDIGISVSETVCLCHFLSNIFCICILLCTAMYLYFQSSVRLIPLPHHAVAQLLHTYYSLSMSEYSATFSGARITLHPEGQPSRLISSTQARHPVQNLEQDNFHIQSHKELLLCSQICA